MKYLKLKLVFSLVFFIFLNSIYFKPDFIDTILFNYNSGPLSYEEIELIEETTPTLTNPFKKPSYIYALKGLKEPYLIEEFSNWRRSLYTVLFLNNKNDFLDSNKATVVFGPKNHFDLYSQNLPFDSFLRGQGGAIQYPNLLFFILYYLNVIILARYIWILKANKCQK